MQRACDLQIGLKKAVRTSFEKPPQWTSVRGAELFKRSEYWSVVDPCRRSGKGVLHEKNHKVRSSVGLKPLARRDRRCAIRPSPRKWTGLPNCLFGSERCRVRASNLTVKTAPRQPLRGLGMASLAHPLEFTVGLLWSLDVELAWPFGCATPRNIGAASPFAIPIEAQTRGTTMGAHQTADISAGRDRTIR